MVFEEFLERALASHHYRSKARTDDPLNAVYNATEFDKIVSQIAESVHKTNRMMQQTQHKQNLLK